VVEDDAAAVRRAGHLAKLRPGFDEGGGEVELLLTAVLHGRQQFLDGGYLVAEGCDDVLPGGLPERDLRARELHHLAFRDVQPFSANRRVAYLPPHAHQQPEEGRGAWVVTQLQIGRAPCRERV